MPNTLVHLGLQVPWSAPWWRSQYGRLWFVLSVLGAVLPDMPWILQRALRPLLVRLGDPEILYASRLYFTVQGSLFATLLLALAVAVLTRGPLRSAAVLGSGSALHLLLDATQVKWGNGVLFGAPFDWKSTRFDWYWPDSRVSDLLTAVSAVVAVWLVVRWWRAPLREESPCAGRLARGRVGIATLLALVYLSAPVVLLDAASRADVHSIGTLRDVGNRAGRDIELYRSTWGVDEHGAWVRTMSQEVLRLVGTPAMDLGEERRSSGGRISLRARFRTETTLEAQEVHRHRPGTRSAFSVFGLLLAGALVWVAERKR